jgi:amino acid adenylation domain-containing protein
VGSATFTECPDRKRTAEAFNQIIERHESLRTVFFIKDGNVYQRVYPTVHFEIQHEATDEAGLQNKIHNFIRPFDLSQPPLMRAMMLNVEDSRTVLLLDMHHIITDGISQNILLREFRQLISGAVTTLPPVTWQYKDIAEWQQSAAYAETLNREEAFWLRELSGEIPLLELPLDSERPRVKRYEGNTLQFTLTQKQTAEVTGFCERHEVTLHMFLLAAWSLTLSKYNTQNELVIGTPVSARSIAEMQEVTGMFVNTLPIRCAVSPESTFTSYLQQVKQKMLAALDNQHYPLEDLVEKLSVPRDTSRNPLFDAVFNLLHASAEGLAGYASELARGYELQRVAKFDVSLTAIHFKTEIQFSLEYAASLFHEDTMRRLAESFKCIVAEVVPEPGTLLGEVSFLPETERKILLESFNQYRLPLPAARSINEIISRYAATSPMSVALVDNWGTIHYSELEDKANLLAAELIEKGVQPGSVVGVSMNNVKEVVVAMIGVLKAGAVFLPFDTQLPVERIRQMLDLSGTRFVICQREHIRKFEPIASLIAIEDIVESGRHARSIALYSPQAYIIFTSGTTGIPNGVQVSHRALLNLCAWHKDFYRVCETDRATKYASLSFDATVWEIFPYLCCGASLYFIEQDVRLDIRQINADLEANGVTMTFLPTQIGEKFTTLPNKSLKKLLLGGDKLKQVDFSRNGYEIYNNYGPTENTVVTSACRVTKDMTRYPIGKPVANNKIYVLRRGRFELVPIGVPGELCVSGESLATGYLDQEATRNAFVNNPFGERMYRTGDLVRWLPDGNLEFLGRINDQVKLRGYRIELAEIESQMMAVPGIEESVVLLRKSEGAEDSLCGYYTARHGLNAEQVRSALKARLPEYMIPAYLVCLDSMPLTHNGKIDKRALPAPQVTSTSRYTAPATLLEQQLTEAWGSVLGLKAEKIGIYDNFFELGGNSMKTILLKEKIAETLQRQVPVVRLFEFTTISAQAAFISEGESMRAAENRAFEAMEKESLDVLNQTLISLNN